MVKIFFRNCNKEDVLTWIKANKKFIDTNINNKNIRRCDKDYFISIETKKIIKKPSKKLNIFDMKVFYK